MGDIDIILPILEDESDDYTDLGVLEKLAAVTGKPIDLFMTYWSDAFNVAGWYDPAKGRWQIRRAFSGGKSYFHDIQYLTFREVVDEVARTAGRPRAPKRELGHPNFPRRHHKADQPQSKTVQQFVRKLYKEEKQNEKI